MTPRQREILAFIQTYRVVNGISPTIRNIADNFGIRSPNGVLCHLKALEKGGHLTRTAFTARSLLPVGDDPKDALLRDVLAFINDYVMINPEDADERDRLLERIRKVLGIGEAEDVAK